MVRGGPARWANLQPRGEPRHQSRVSPCRNGDAEPRVYVERDGPRLAEAILLRRRVAGTAGPKPRQLGPRVKDRQTLAAVSSPHIRPRRCSWEGQRGLGECRQTQPEGAVGVTTSQEETPAAGGGRPGGGNTNPRTREWRGKDEPPTCLVPVSSDFPDRGAHRALASHRGWAFVLAFLGTEARVPGAPAAAATSSGWLQTMTTNLRPASGPRRTCAGRERTPERAPRTVLTTSPDMPTPGPPP